MYGEFDLVQRSKAGDLKAFEELVVMHQKQIYNLAYRMTGNGEDACDIVQETFLRAFKSIAKFNMNSTFGTWLYRIAANICIDHIRKKKKARVYPFSYQDNPYQRGGELLTQRGESPEEQVERRYERERIQLAINRLPEDHRTVIVLRDIQGKTYKEIADILKLNIGTVKSRINRARLNLKEELKRVEEQKNKGCV